MTWLESGREKQLWCLFHPQMLYSGAWCFIQMLLEIGPPFLACTILFLSMFSSISLCTFIRAKFEHLVLAILPVSRTGICWFRQLKRIILASAINLGGAGLRPTAPRSSKNLMGQRPIAPRSQIRPWTGLNIFILKSRYKYKKLVKVFQRYCLQGKIQVKNQGKIQAIQAV